MYGYNGKIVSYIYPLRSGNSTLRQVVGLCMHGHICTCVSQSTVHGYTRLNFDLYQ